MFFEPLPSCGGGLVQAQGERPSGGRACGAGREAEPARFPRVRKLPRAHRRAGPIRVPRRLGQDEGPEADRPVRQAAGLLALRESSAARPARGEKAHRLAVEDERGEVPVRRDVKYVRFDPRTKVRNQPLRRTQDQGWFRCIIGGQKSAPSQVVYDKRRIISQIIR